MARCPFNWVQSFSIIKFINSVNNFREVHRSSRKISSEAASYFHLESPNYRKFKRVDNLLVKTTFGTPLSKLRQNMDVSLLMPPITVRGMTKLDTNMFQKQISVPILKIPGMHANSLIKQLKSKLLKMDRIKPIQIPSDDTDSREILLNPLLVKNQEDVQEQINTFRDMSHGDVPLIFDSKLVTIRYENWKSEDILQSVLPEDKDGAASYSLIGHILHLNLKDHLQPYKHLIGQVLLDKTPNVKMVVNKTNTIDSTYRNFEMEILAGEGSTITTVKENNCKFSLDFAKVYWNPRLATEHERIVMQLKQGDVLYDVMAGIGPFTVPAGKKECHVLANDLNPHSYQYLTANVKANKVTDRVKCHNLDGNEFIKTVLKKDLLNRWNDKHFCGKVHVTMNLPKCAVEFIPSFVGLISESDLPDDTMIEKILPLIHVYMFTKDSDPNTALSLVGQHLGYNQTKEIHGTYESSNNKNGNLITEEAETTTNKTATENSKPSVELDNADLENMREIRQHISEVIFVRRVAPNKVMMRVSIKLPLNIIMKTEDENEPPLKKTKVSDSV